MTTFTVNINDKQSEKVIKAFFDALNIPYQIQTGNVDEACRPLNKKEQELFDRLKNSLSDIKKYEKGELELKDARIFLNEFSS
ncbi:hypothetical protein [Olivibacter sitiensis]|uniref:hypothetical protein n=1 Tax=Olivibacter sitiensis TaxID=376470 RepID=UPI00042415E1|nr:hypothetical protein [Olivibacter sitiensis]